MTENNIKTTLCLVLCLVFQITETANYYNNDECRMKTAEGWRKEAENSIEQSDNFMKNIQQRYCSETPVLLSEMEPLSEKKRRIHNFVQHYFAQYDGELNCALEDQTLVRDIQLLDEFEWQLRNYVQCYNQVLNRTTNNEDFVFYEKLISQLDKIDTCKQLWLASYKIAIDEQCIKV